MIRGSLAVYRLVVKHRLVFVVAAVILVALLMTWISMSLYISSGASSLDLSRPGYSQARSEVVTIPDRTFSTTGTLDLAATEQFKDFFDEQRAALDGLGNFDDPALQDESLGF